jgi:hypothetical protein
LMLDDQMGDTWSYAYHELDSFMSRLSFHCHFSNLLSDKQLVL